MRLNIRTPKGITFPLFLPNGFLVNPISYRILRKHIQFDVDYRQFKVLKQELKQVRKTHGHLELIRIETRDGMVISIKL